jgi:hypothetical protein
MVLEKVGPLALAAALLGCGACASLKQGPDAAAQARWQFANDTFCPESRVTAQRVIPMPEPPPAIANDPERLAMWHRKYEAQADQKRRRTIAVAGCGAQATYACWEFSGMTEGTRSPRHVMIGSACDAVGQEPTSSVPFGPGAPEGPQGATSRSTTEDPQPNTTASSR